MATTKACNRLNGRLHLDTERDLMKRPDSWDFRYDPGATFPEVPIGYGITTQLVWVTPSLAEEWLGRLHERQRSQKKNHQRSLNEDLANDRFRLNGESIIFDSDNRLIDGRHRCEMVKAVGKPILALVVRGVAPEVYATIDDSAKRSGADALHASGIMNATNTAAAVVMFVRYQRGMIFKNALVLSPIAISEILEKHPGLVASVSLSGNYKDFPSNSTIAVCHYILGSIHKTDADLFFARLLSGEGLSRTDAILTLRNRIYRERGIHRDEVMALIFKAWNYWRAKKPLRCLKIQPDETLQTPV